jgi:hypothetical protein
MSAFGSCCKDLREAVAQPLNSFLELRKGIGFVDRAVIFCPLCVTNNNGKTGKGSLTTRSCGRRPPTPQQATISSSVCFEL